MIELEKLLNDLYKGIPIKKDSLGKLTTFVIPREFKNRREIFELLDDLSSSEGKDMLEHIEIYKKNEHYQLKVFINTHLN